MSYETELEPLVKWVRAHPGLTAARLKKSIQESPPTPEVPSSLDLKWKLRYLELAGDVRSEKMWNQRALEWASQYWFATN